MDESLRQPCVAPQQPADPVTPSDVLQFSLAQGEQAACEAKRAKGLLDTIDAHNEAADE